MMANSCHISFVVVILEQRDELLSLLLAQSQIKQTKSEAMKQETPYMKLKKAKIDRRIWYSQARIETKSLSRTLQKIAEVELICAQLEAEIREKRDGKTKQQKKENTEFPQR